MTGSSALDWLAGAAQARRAAGVHRELRPRPAGSPLLDLASNDYLGLSRDERVVSAAVNAVRRWGTGATGSRLVSGTTELHRELEVALAALVGAPAALVFSSGYLANVGVITALSGPDCVVVCDRGNHASLVDGCRLATSPLRVVRHGDLAATQKVLAARSQRRALVVIDAVGSADGDLLPLVGWYRLARRYGALLLVDDAHGLGVRGGGRGAVAEAGLAGEPDVVTTVTLSKSLAAQGGAVLGATAVIEHLVDTCRTFIFDTALNPAAVGAALAAVKIVAAEPDLAGTVLARAADLATACGVAVPDAAIVPVIIGDAGRAHEMSIAIRQRGISVGCFRPPSVPAGTARLRITARASLNDSDVERFAQVIQEVSGW